MKSMKVYLCGAGDISNDMGIVTEAVSWLNGSISYMVGITLDVHFWKIEEAGLNAQDRIFKEIFFADLIIFIFYQQLGNLTQKEFNLALECLSKSNQPDIKVWFKYVPHEFERDPGPEYKRLLDFKKSLSNITPSGLMYSQYRNTDSIAASFSENQGFLPLENLVYQELTPFLLRKTGQFNDVIVDKTHLSTRIGITREMIINHWKQRAKRPGIAAVMSSRYAEKYLEEESANLVNFVLTNTEQYISRRSVIEFGSGIGRFTLPLFNKAKKLTAVEMCPEMISRAREQLGEAWNKIDYIDSFVEDFHDTNNTYDCAFSCLLFIHILDEDNLQRAINRIKASANTVILCEHIDEKIQNEGSNFTRIWPRSVYQKLFGEDFYVIDSHKYTYFEDNLELIIFQRKSLDIELSQRAIEILKHVQYRNDLSFPDEWKRWYHLFQTDNLTFPYEHLLGSYQKNAYEFSFNDVTIHRNQGHYELPENIRHKENNLTQKVVDEIIRKNDYKPKDETKVRIDKIEVSQIDPLNTLPGKMEIYIRQLRYFQYLIMKDMLNMTSGDFREKHTAYKPASPRRIENSETTNIGGCGIFLLTKDNYVVLCQREKVVEYPGMIGYSASGSMSWHYPLTTNLEANPFLTIIRETYEELGVQLDVEQLRLFSVGIDIKGFFIQFSFYAHVPIMASEVLRLWQGAHAKYEQIPFVIPITIEKLSEILFKYSMEPSEAATLIQLSCKLLDQKKFMQRLKNLYQP